MILYNNNGIIIHTYIGILVVVVSLLILFFNIEVPNELKGFIFYAQVSLFSERLQNSFKHVASN